MAALTVGQKRLCSGAGWFAVAPRGKDATTSFCVECRNRQHLFNQYQVKNDTSAIQLMTSYALYMPSLIKKNHQTHLCIQTFQTFNQMLVSYHYLRTDDQMRAFYYQILC